MRPKSESIFFARGLRRVEAGLRSTFNRWDYREVVVPSFVPRDKGDLSEADNRWKPASDATVTIARWAKTAWKEGPRPLRVCYLARLLRPGGETEEDSPEVFQAGAELIGPAEEDGDAEVLALACRALRQAGSRDFEIHVGHHVILRRILEETGLVTEQRGRVRRLLRERDFVAARDLLRRGKGEVAEEMWRLLTPWAQRKGRDDGKLPPALTERSAGSMARTLQRVERLVDDPPLRLDMTLVRDFDYYTGLVFEIYHEPTGLSLGGGGRYDELLGRFGSPEAAAGFALNLKNISRATGLRNQPSHEHERCLVLSVPKRMETARRCAQRWRDKGFPTALRFLSPLPGEDDAKKWARKRSYRRLMIVDETNPPLIYELSEKGKTTMSPGTGDESLH